MRRLVIRALLVLPVVLFAAACSSPTAPNKPSRAPQVDHMPWT